MVAVFVGLLCVGEGLVNQFVDWGSEGGRAVGSLAIMWTPAVAGIVAALVGRGSLRGFGWGLGAPHWLIVAYLVCAAYGTAPFVIDTLAEGGSFTVRHWASYSDHLGLGTSVVLGPLLLATVEPLFGMIAAAGEEIGWRGFLLPTLAAGLGFWRAVGLSWVIWLGFHLPGMLGGDYHGAGTPLWFSLACFAAMLFGATVILSVLRLVSGSIWPCIVAHAVHNLYIQEVAPSALSGGPATPWLVGEFGAFTVLSIGVVAWGMLRVGRRYGVVQEEDRSGRLVTADKDETPASLNASTATR